jgi:hypothetical protein
MSNKRVLDREKKQTAVNVATGVGLLQKLQSKKVDIDEQRSTDSRTNAHHHQKLTSEKLMGSVQKTMGRRMAFFVKCKAGRDEYGARKGVCK